MIRRITPFWKKKAARKIVLPSEVQFQLNEIVENISEYLDKNYRILLIGKSSEGKTMTQYLDVRLDYPLFRVDLASILNKYIGETEKNLNKLFSKAENKDWILFFDEADALFGKRTEITDAHDRYANIETNSLLQRIEDYGGLIVLASNSKGKISEETMKKLNIDLTIEMFDEDSKNEDEEEE